MTPEKRELLRQFIDAVEKLAFEMPAPNAYTPRFVQMCQEARSLLTRSEAQRETPALNADSIDISKLANQCLNEEQRKALFVTRWKDGIDVDYPTYQLCKFVEAVLEEAERELSAKREGFVTAPLQATPEMIEAYQVGRIEQLTETRMTDSQFRAFLSLLMVSDPWPLDFGQDELDQFAENESRKRGYDNWIEAYHRFEP